MPPGKKYKTMLKGMAQKEQANRKRKAIQEWIVYVLRCMDGTLYTGVTNNIERRLKMHNNGKAAKYTRVRRPVKLLYQENCKSRTQALVRECQIKSFPKKKKEELVSK